MEESEAGDCPLIDPKGGDAGMDGPAPFILRHDAIGGYSHPASDARSIPDVLSFRR